MYLKMKVSVIIPSYNAKPEYLTEAIGSVINQTVKPYEIIIVDDGSDAPIMGTFASSADNIKIIRNEKNMGIGFSRQRGVDNATGDYITFLSSDDIWDEKYLEIMIKTAKEQPNKILYSNYFMINEKSKIIATARVKGYDNHEDFCVACLDSAYKNTMFVNFSTTFFPKKVFEKLKFKYRFGEDLYFLLISMRDFEYYFVQDYLLKYRAVDNTTSRIRHKIPENNDKIIKEVREYWER